MSAGEPVSAHLACAGCGRQPNQDDLLPFRCRAASPGDGTDHVLRRHLDLSRVRFIHDDQPNPFLRYRELLYAYHMALHWGLDDADFVQLVAQLDQQVAQVHGHGFMATPLEEQPDLARRLSLPRGCRLWVKDETGNVAHSHKARHLMNVAIYLSVLQRTGRLSLSALPRLAISSCGNAALAAAVLARALKQPLDVFVPPDAQPAVVTRLQALGAHLTSCMRSVGQPGDPCYHRFREALDGGAVPFSCQGNENGLAVEGGHTLAYELVEQLVGQGAHLDRLLIQVGGGALASACVHGLREARELGLIERLPRVCVVQTEGAAPLVRAYQRIRRRPGLDPANPASVTAALTHAATHRGDFMWPWEAEPRSVAHGILDDETYDWLAVIEGMLLSGGEPLTVDESILCEANQVAQTHTSIPVCHTGTAGLAALMQLARTGALREQENIGVIFTGAMYT